MPESGSILVISVVIILTILIIAYMALKSQDNTQEMKGLYADSYEVLADYPDSEEAVKLLSSVNNDLINFLRYLKYKYLVYKRKSDGAIVRWCDMTDYDDINDYEPVYSNRLTQIVRRITTRYNPEVITENRPGKGESETSYTVDKGRKMYVCLRDAKTNRLHDKSVILFVMLHELSHIGNAAWGHRTSDFWPTFKFILYEATKFGIVPNIDYSKHPVAYCGSQLSYSPLYDNTLPSWWL
jgi:hypothetical protein